MQAKPALSYIGTSMPSDHYKLFLIDIDPKWCAADFTLIF